MENLFNRNFVVFAVLALVVLGGFFFFKGDEAAPAADNSLEAVDQAAAVETVPVVEEGVQGATGAVAK